MNRVAMSLLAALMMGTASVQAMAACNVEFLTSIPLPCGNGIGLTWDGTYLWVADSETRKAVQVNPVTGKVVRSIPFPAVDPPDWPGTVLRSVSRIAMRISSTDWIPRTERSCRVSLCLSAGRVVG